jgi:hypothetical protein
VSGLYATPGSISRTLRSVTAWITNRVGLRIDSRRQDGVRSVPFRVDTRTDFRQKPLPMGETMTYVVEIEDKHGRRAIKEYEASSPYDLVGRVRYELKPYPDFRPVGAWSKDQPEKVVHL